MFIAICSKSKFIFFNINPAVSYLFNPCSITSNIVSINISVCCHPIDGSPSVFISFTVPSKLCCIVAVLFSDNLIIPLNSFILNLAKKLKSFYEIIKILHKNSLILFISSFAVKPSQAEVLHDY